MKPATRIGFGWDSHEFSPAFPSRSVASPSTHSKGLGGHSDGDVLLHAITDALLGAIGAPDIGTLFPPSDPQWKGADSAVFLNEALKRVRAAGYGIGNVDSSLIMLAPKIGPHAANIRGHVSKLLGIPIDCVGLKAKTPEGIGTDNAAIANVVVLLEKAASAPKKSPARPAPPQPKPEIAREGASSSTERSGCHCRRIGIGSFDSFNDSVVRATSRNLQPLANRFRRLVMARIHRHSLRVAISFAYDSRQQRVWLDDDIVGDRHLRPASWFTGDLICCRSDPARYTLRICSP